MAFKVEYSFNNGKTTGTATNAPELRKAITKAKANKITQCTLSGSIDGDLRSDKNGKTSDGDYSLLRGCTALKEVDLSNLDTSEVTDMSYAFAECKSLKTVDISTLDTSNVTNMEHMFDGCTGMKELDVSTFDTSNVTNMDSMFNGCKSARTINVSSLDTSNVENMNSMFSGCAIVTELNVNDFNTEKVGDVSGMFKGCTALTNLDVSNFQLAPEIKMDDVFYGCSKIQLTTDDLIKKIPVILREYSKTYIGGKSVGKVVINGRPVQIKFGKHKNK